MFNKTSQNLDDMLFTIDNPEFEKHIPDIHTEQKKKGILSKIEKVPRGIRGEKSSKDMASSRNLVSTIGALASPKMGDGTRCLEG